MKILSFSRPYLSAQKGKVIAYTLIHLLMWGISLLTPYTVGFYIDGLVDEKSVEFIGRMISFLCMLWTLQIVLSYIKNMALSYLHSKVCFQLTFDVLTHISRLPISFFSTANPASLNQLISSDSRIITGYVLGEIHGVASDILTIICAVYITATLDWKLVVIMITFLPVYALIYICFRKPIYRLRHKVTEEYSQYYSLTSNFLENIKVIKLHEWNGRYLKKVKRFYSSVHCATMQNAKTGYLMSNVDMVVRYIANIAIFVYCGKQVMSDSMSVGEFTMINSYCTMIISAIGNILYFGKSRQQAVVSLDRLNSWFGKRQEECGTKKLTSVSEIEVTDLMFSYNGKPVISGLNCCFEKGKIYAIIGENGSGKSTLINILCGMEQNYSGRITFDGVDSRELDHRYMKECIFSIVEQEPNLIFPTLRENMQGALDSDAELIKWMKKFDMLDFLQMINSDLGYRVSNHATNLSGGEKQKIAILRSLIKKSDVLILDEPNSAFDVDGTESLCETLIDLKKDKIIIVITHRMELQNICDVIISLDGGAT